MRGGPRADAREGNHVETSAAVEIIAAGPTNHGVVAGSAEQGVCSGRTGGDQGVVAGPAEQHVAAGNAATDDGVVARAADDGIGRIVADQQIAVIAADDVFDVQQMIADGDAGIGAGGQINRRRAGGILIADPIVAAAAIHGEGRSRAHAADEGVGIAGALDDLDIDEGIALPRRTAVAAAGQIDGHAGGLGGEADGVDTGAAVIVIAADRPHLDDVVARAAKDGVDVGITNDGVAVIAADDVFEVDEDVAADRHLPQGVGGGKIDGQGRSRIDETDGVVAGSAV